MTQLRRHIVVSESTDVSMTVNSEGRGDVVQHEHPSRTAIHITVNNLTTGVYRYVIVDMSDTVNYKHIAGEYAHLEWVEIQIDSDNTGAFTAGLGFVENVDASGGDRYIVKHWSGDKTAGNSFQELVNLYPNGWRMISSHVTTHEVSLADAGYQADVLLPSTLNPTAADTYPGDGDVVLEVTVEAGSVNMSFELSYHTH